MIEIKQFISEKGQPSPGSMYVSQKQHPYTIKIQSHFSQFGHRGNPSEFPMQRQIIPRQIKLFMDLMASFLY